MAVDEDGRFTEKVSDFKGLNVKDADKETINAVKVIIFELLIPFLLSSVTLIFG